MSDETHWCDPETMLQLIMWQMLCGPCATELQISLAVVQRPDLQNNLRDSFGQRRRELFSCSRLAGLPATSLPVRLRVLPIKLERPPTAYAFYPC